MGRVRRLIENKAEDEHDEKDEAKRDEPVVCLVKSPVLHDVYSHEQELPRRIAKRGIRVCFGFSFRGAKNWKMGPSWSDHAFIKFLKWGGPGHLLM